MGIVFAVFYFTDILFNNWGYPCLVILVLVFLYAKIHRYLRLYEENSTFDIINDLYSQFHQLTNLYRDWQLSHILCITKEEYDKTSFEIQGIVKDLSEEELIELRLKEKHMVVSILVFYEQVYYQFNHSKMFEKRKKFLYNLNDYFLSRLLFQNPRIVYYIITNPNGVGLHLEQESYQDILIKYEEEIGGNALENSVDGCQRTLFYDENGPFCKGAFSSCKGIKTTEELSRFVEKGT